MTKWGLFQACKAGSTLETVTVILEVKKRNKNHMIPAADAERVFDKIQNPFMVKIVSKLGLSEGRGELP